MDYPAPSASVVAPAAKLSTLKIVLIIVGVIVAGLLVIGAVAIALGVGLGVGLSKKSDSSSSSSNNTYSILSAPTVNCTYTGSSSCGCSAIQPSFLSPRITQGYTAVTNSWPWIVALYMSSNSSLCGGVLVTYQHVLTAAHCVQGITASTIRVYAGIQLLSTAQSTGQSRNGLTVTPHPSYSPSDYTNDIAIIKLQTAFSQTSTVGKCCLPTDTSLPTTGERGVIAGWGKISSSSSGPSDNLLQGVIQVQSDSSSCSASSTIATRFCAGYSGTDSCFGDSGSPFMTSVNNSWTCTGIVSSGTGCGQNSYYTRVSGFQTFINTYINL